MRERVDFWKRVYTEIDSTEAFLHDPEHVTAVYGKISYGHLSDRAQRNFIRQAKREIRDRLRTIVRKNRQDLDPEESELLKIVGEHSDNELLQMARRVRRQQGMRDRYYQGLVRAQPYINMIRTILKSRNVPEELAYLPHVESSFNYRAYSKVGAAGMWQFMRGTARRYNLKINYVVDERRDPEQSTAAAARFLRDNFERLEAWPLAITAYNHGPASIARAVQRLGTKDIGQIVERYQSRNFGFASKNFYASFMATVEISENFAQYFPNVPFTPLPETMEVRLNNRLTAHEIAKVAEISVDEFQDLNLSLRPSVFQNRIRLPKGIVIKVPAKAGESNESFLAKLGAIEVKEVAIASTRTHTVRRGQNLTLIAGMYNVPLRDVLLLNEIGDPSLIRPGRVLKIPGRGAEWQQERAELYARVEANSDEENKETATVEEQDTMPAVPLDAGLATSSDTALAPGLVSAVDRPSFWETLKNWFYPSRLASRSSDAGDSASTTVAASGESQVEIATGTDTASASGSANHSEGVASANALKVEFDSKNYDLELKELSKNLVEIRVEPEETLSHYADWSAIPSYKIRRSNRIGQRGNIRIGQKLRLPLNEGSRARFEVARLQFHQAIEEDFYGSYKIAKWEPYKVNRGENLIGILDKNSIPLWLLRKRNPDILQTRLQTGAELLLPVLEAIDSAPTLTEQLQEDS